MEPLSIDLIRPAPHSPEVLEAASGGGSRASIIFYIVHPPRRTESYVFDSIVEMQAFLVTLIQKFDISPADHHPQIKRSKSGLLVPLVLGEEYKGAQLPLKITAIRHT